MGRDILLKDADGATWRWSAPDPALVRLPLPPAVWNALSPDGATLASADREGIVHLVDTASLKERARFNLAPTARPDGAPNMGGLWWCGTDVLVDRVATRGNGWRDARTGELRAQRPGSGVPSWVFVDPVGCAAVWEAGGGPWARASATGPVTLLNVPSLTQCLAFAGPWTVAFPDDGDIAIFEGSRLVASVSSSRLGIRSGAALDGTHLATAGYAGTVRIWDLGSLREPARALLDQFAARRLPTGVSPAHTPPLPTSGR